MAKHKTDTLAIEAAAAQMVPVLAALQALTEPDRIEALNRIKLALHAVSPFAAEPVDCVLWVQNGRVKGNDYNPNKVAPIEMDLLRHSIAMDGYTQPIVAHEADGKKLEVVDGFHRHKVGKTDERVKERVRGYLPVVVVNPGRTDRKDRIAATIRHNRARGVHAVRPMSDIVGDLVRLGWADEQIAVELGMEPDEVLRLKQATGLAEIFKDAEYSKSWS